MTEVKRPYAGAARAMAAAQTKLRLVETAARQLAEQPNLAGFSLEAVAKAAGVTRLTVYNQFGSRRALLEAVFDHVSGQAGLPERIQAAMQLADPRDGLITLIQALCTFWEDMRPIARLHDAASADPELAEALDRRNERRRQAISVLTERLGRRGDQDLVDVIFTLTSFRAFESLKRGRTGEDACRILTQTCLKLLD